jgi:hypothetical protein
MPYAPQGVKGPDDDLLCVLLVLMHLALLMFAVVDFKKVELVLLLSML